MPVNRLPTIKTGLYVLGLKKGEDRYVFLYDNAHRVDVLRTLGRWAADPELELSWYDAAALSQKVRGTYSKAQEGSE